MSPEIAVIVASHDRPLRLRWLLNALEEQTLEPDRFEVVVGHDSAGPDTAELLETHPLAAAGLLSAASLPPGSASPGANRNAALRRARAPLVAFTDDDCRPPPAWLERALAAARRHPGAIVQGRTVPDPEEQPLLAAPHARTQRIDPPVPWAQACNIVYPRELVERAGGFDERLATGEDTDLRVRVQRLGAAYEGAPELVTYHAVHPESLVGRLRSLPRWSDLPRLVKSHPGLRADFPLWLFWKRTHAWLPLAVAAAVLERRHPFYAALAVPWLMQLPGYGTHPRARLRTLLEAPGRAVIDAAEIAVMVRGSVRHRTVFL